MNTMEINQILIENDVKSVGLKILWFNLDIENMEYQRKIMIIC